MDIKPTKGLNETESEKTGLKLKPDKIATNKPEEQISGIGEKPADIVNKPEKGSLLGLGKDNDKRGKTVVSPEEPKIQITPENEQVNASQEIDSANSSNINGKEIDFTPDNSAKRALLENFMAQNPGASKE